MSESEIWGLISKHLAGESSAEETKVLEDWITKSKENKKTFELMKNVWSTENRKLDINKDQMWNNISEKAGFTQSDKNIFFNNKLLKYAAVIIFLLILPILYFSIYDTDSLNQNIIEVIVKSGESKTVNLPDGSKVTLDAGSILSYSNNFNYEERLVKLKGEGYFEVQHNPKKPFKVDMLNSVVEVLGTKFNLRNWSENSVVEVTEGKVSFSDLNKTNEIILTKGLRSKLNKKGIPSPAEQYDVMQATSWMKKERYFVNTPVSDVFEQLERWYKLEISINNSDLLNHKLNLEVKDTSVSEILDIIAVLINNKYKIESNNVTFY